MMTKLPIENIETTGDVPLPRFGHTITQIAKNIVIMFGGATGDTGKYSMTGDTFSLNTQKKCWAKINTTGISPTPRAAHSATAVDANQLVVYGGATGGGSLASDDLYLLDLRQGEENAQWMIVPVVGNTPGRRYGHTIVYLKPYLVVFGGNTGQEPSNDSWILCVEKAPFAWQKVDMNECPPPRVYHSASICQNGSANGMMIVYGGRTSDQTPLNDIWGLRKHRDGKWDWVRAPYKQGDILPTARYQHSILFMGSALLCLGGRTTQMNDPVGLEVYDADTSEWYKFPPLNRFRHTSWVEDGLLFIHGGFEQYQPNIPSKLLSIIDIDELFKNYPNLMRFKANTNKKDLIKSAGKYKADSSEDDKKQFKLAESACVAMTYNPDNPENSKLSTKVSIEKLTEESKKLSIKIKPSLSAQKPSKDSVAGIFITILYRPKDWTSLPPNDTKFTISKERILELIKECKCIVESEPNILRFATPVKVFGNLYGQFSDLVRMFEFYKGPIDGSLTSDIDSFDYLFLGNYVDRGKFSLETICILMSLKVKFPTQVHLLRGYHEIKSVNMEYGLAHECQMRLGENINEPGSIFQEINNFFNYLPLAAIVDDTIICVHSGIGSMKNLEPINLLKRPIEAINDGSVGTNALMDILCSNPSDGIESMDTERDITNPMKCGSYSSEIVEGFLKASNMQLLIRSHQTMIEGFTTCCNSKVMSITSSTDYCGQLKNTACILVIKKTLEVVPKVLMPMEGWSSKCWNQDEELLKKRPPTPPLRIV